MEALLKKITFSGSDSFCCFGAEVMESFPDEGKGQLVSRALRQLRESVFTVMEIQG